MKALKTFLDVVVIGYVIFLVLLLSTILKEQVIADISSGEQLLEFYKIVGAIGAGIMLARLLVSNLYIASIKHEQHLANLKINGLKADLYEKRQEFRHIRQEQPKAEVA